MLKPRVTHIIITEEAIQWTEAYSDTRAYKCYQAATSLVPETKTSNFSIGRGCSNMLFWGKLRKKNHKILCELVIIVHIIVQLTFEISEAEV